jgi:hypothetical protein
MSNHLLKQNAKFALAALLLLESLLADQQR